MVWGGGGAEESQQSRMYQASSKVHRHLSIETYIGKEYCRFTVCGNELGWVL